MILNTTQTKEISTLLKAKNLVVLPTDTIYGIHCLALNADLIEKVREVKQRPETFPFITLISDVKDIAQFNIDLDNFELEQTKKFWPGPNTLIFKNRSFRLPNNHFLIEILKQTGPIISTSANLHGQPNSTTIEEAQAYFKDSIEYYVDGGKLDNPPSSVYKVENQQIIKIR